jgi:hypothetical protein
VKSSRRGDFSRLTFDPAKHYSSVLMQQGRVQLDADWNEQVDIAAHRLRTLAMDTIGATGAPAGSSGFEIVPRASLRFDGKSRYLTLGHSPSEHYGARAALTIEARIRPREGGKGGVVLCRFDRLEPGQPLQYAYMVSVLPDGRLALDRSGASSRGLLGDTELPFDGWSTITLSHDDRRHRLEIDGRPVGELDEGYERDSLGALFLVGQSHVQGGGEPGFNGSLREIRLSGETAAGAGEVLGWWRFDRGGDVTLDLSGHGNHAVLGGSQPETRPTLELEDLLVGSGRYYAEGVLCENERTVRVSEQPDLPGLELPADRAPGRSYLFYLETREQYVAPAQDPSLREPALGGADTAARTRIVAQARWMPMELDAMPADPAAGVAEWQELLGVSRSSGRLQARRPSRSPGRLENRFYRIEVHSAPRRSAPDEPSAAGSFKWSRDNASTVVAVVAREAGSPVLSLASAESGKPPFAEGDALEIVDDRSVLAGTATGIYRVESVDPDTRAVTLDRPPPGDIGTRPERHPVAVRWDGFTQLREGSWRQLECGVEQGLMPAGGQEPEHAVDPKLEHGIEVRFVADDGEDAGEDLGFRPGDHWTFAARTATGTIDWPADADGEPAALAAGPADRSLSPLAVLRFDEWGFDLRDCRPVFHPLSTGAVSKAGDRMHGPLEIRPQPSAAGGEREARRTEPPALLVAGTAQADTLLGAIGTPGAVETFGLADAAVTRSKISPDVGTVPPGFAILGDGPEPPPGYEPTGASLVVPTPTPQWVVRARLAIGEEPAELHSAAVGGQVFTFSSTGRTWSFDPARGALDERRPMPEARGRFAAAAANGKLYLVGGIDDRGEKVRSVLEYDPAADDWAWREPLPTPRSDLALAVADGKLYALGGLRDLLLFEVVSRHNEVYDPLIDDWTRRRPLPTARYAMTAAAGGRGVFALGGRRRWFLRWLGRAVSAVNEEYMPGVDRWARRPNSLPAPRSEGAAAVIGDAIFVVGGRSLFGWSADASRFAPRGDGWEPSASLEAPVVSPGVAAVDGRLVLHAMEPGSDNLEVQECRISSTFHVHRKSAEPEGDLEPQLRVPPQPARPGEGI